MSDTNLKNQPVISSAASVNADQVLVGNLSATGRAADMRLITVGAVSSYVLDQIPTPPAASGSNPQALGVVSPGGQATWSRADHVHPVTGLAGTRTDFATLRANNLAVASTGLPLTVQVQRCVWNNDGGGVFTVDTADTTTADDGQNTIVDAANNRWKRISARRPRINRQSRRSPEVAQATRVGQLIRMTRALAQSINSATLTSLIWDTTQFNNLGALYAAPNTERLTIPASLNGCTVRVSAFVRFAANATGFRRVRIRRNGADMVPAAEVTVAASGATYPTNVQVQTATVRGSTGDYFSCVVEQDSGVALDANPVWFQLEVVRDGFYIGNRNGLVMQYLYQNLWPTPSAMGASLADYSQVILSHAPVVVLPNNFPVPTGSPGCIDTPYSGWAEAVRTARALNPTMRLFGYVAGSADAPANTTCGYTNDPLSPWTSTTVPNVSYWIDLYATLPEDIRPDGIFFDIVAPFSNGGWMDATTRDAVYAAARARGMAIMANSTSASFVNVAFAAEGLTTGDVVFIEGFEIAAGVSKTASTAAAMAEALRWRGNGVSVYCLGSSAVGVSPTTLEADTIRAAFTAQAWPGDVLQIQDAGLGRAPLYPPAFPVDA